MKLLSAAPSPFARKARIALAEKGLAFELVTEVPYNAGATAPRHNPLGKVPVLVLDDGATVYDSDFILDWLEVHHPQPPLFPADPRERLAARRLQVLADGVCDALVVVLLEGLRAQPSQPWRTRHLGKVAGGLAEVARLLPGDGFAVGGRFGVADIAVGAMLGYLSGRYLDADWRAAYPHLAGYYDMLMTRPSFAGTVPAPQQMDPGVI